MQQSVGGKKRSAKTITTVADSVSTYVGADQNKNPQPCTSKLILHTDNEDPKKRNEDFQEPGTGNGGSFVSHRSRHG